MYKERKYYFEKYTIERRKSIKKVGIREYLRGSNANSEGYYEGIMCTGRKYHFENCHI